MLRNALAALLLLTQLGMLGYARVEPSAHFHWAPYDVQNEYWIDVRIDGRALSSSEIAARYREPAVGIDFHAIEHVLDVVRQYEETYGRADGASVAVRYRVNGGPMRHWRWP
jgi:hypothetical protein